MQQVQEGGLEGEAAVTPAQARDALARVTGSAQLRPMSQLAAFLNFIVLRTLEGREKEIKGYTIAVEALGRPESFDPLIDPIVRVEAGRLRKALADYYAGPGRDDPVRIEVPRGAYVPRFIRVVCELEREEEVGRVILRSGPSHAPPAALPPAAAPPAVAPPARRLGPKRLAGIALLAFLAAGGALLSLRLGSPTLAPPSEPEVEITGATSFSRTLPVLRLESVASADPQVGAVSSDFQMMLSDALARFDEFAVLDVDAMERAGGRKPPATYVIEHRGVRQGDVVMASLRVIHAATGRVVWSTTEDQAVSTLDRPREVRELARRVSVRLAQPYGVIHADLRGAYAPPHPMACITRSYDYWLAPSEALHASARDCLEAATRDSPAFHPAWALLAFLHLDEHRIGYNRRDARPLDRAQAAAQRAMALAPESARAAQAMMAVLMVRGEVEEAIRLGFTAVRRNPFDTDILADVGARLTQAGRGMEGRPLLLRAADLNAARPPWHEFFLFLSARDGNDKVAMAHSLNMLRGSEAPLALLALAIGAADRGDRAESRSAIRRLAELSPVFRQDAGAFLDRAFFAPPVRASILAALGEGGLEDTDQGNGDR